MVPIEEKHIYRFRICIWTQIHVTIISKVPEHIWPSAPICVIMQIVTRGIHTWSSLQTAPWCRSQHPFHIFFVNTFLQTEPFELFKSLNCLTVVRCNVGTSLNVSAPVSSPLTIHWAVILQTAFSNAFLNENVWYSIEISLKFFLKCPINNIPELVPILAWRRPGDNP